jgi:hypothetical protein
MVYRTLIIGLERDKYIGLFDDNIKIYQYLEDAPTLYDYEIILLFSEGLRYPSLASKKGPEFDLFFSNGGILVLFSSEPIPSGIFPGFEFQNMIFKGGEVITPNKKHMLSRIFEKYECIWAWHGNGTIPVDFIIAWNSINCEVACELNFKDGKIFLFPLIKKPDQLPEYISEIIRSIEVFMGFPVSSQPDWFERYNYEHELALKDEESKISNQLKEIELIKSILYIYGNSLSRRICKLLNNIGFKADWTELKAKHDIEIDFNGTTGIVEVRGLKGPANNEDIRQLLDHYLEYFEKHQHNNVKGIFIINHFRETDPKDRGSPFTDAAIKIAERQDFCLITTLDLFKIYDSYLNKKLSLDDLRAQIIGSNGLFQKPKT